MTRSSLSVFLAVMVGAAVLGACGDEGGGEADGTGGVAALGGASTTGGAPATGAQPATGGATTTGGQSATGGGESCPTWEQVNAQILTPYCVSCHGATRPEAGVRLDSQAAAESRAGDAAMAIVTGTMPDGGPALGSDLAGLAQAWAACVQ